MRDTQDRPHQPWQFGFPCEGCGAPMVHFCPLCGADLFLVDHGALWAGPLGEQVHMSLCIPCCERLEAGRRPPFRVPGEGMDR